MSLAPPTATGTIHASCCVVGEAGVLVRGPSGSGKSSLCLALLERAYRDGRHACFVGDDRIRLAVHHGRLVASGHPTLTGMVEIRGAGFHRLARSAPGALVRLVVDLVPLRPRMPPEADGVTILGVRLPALALEPREPREYLVVEALASQCGDVASRSHPAALSCDAPGPV